MSGRGRGVAALAAATLLLVACEGKGPVGEGGGPQSVRIVYGTQTTLLQTVECAAAQLTAIARFTGDAVSDNDVSARVTWRSSNPGVIDVSNGDIETAPGSGAYFPAGTVIARTTGDAVIQADYAGLYANFSVNAAALDSMRISPVLTRLTPDSQTSFRLYARTKADQLEQDLTDSAVWRVPSTAAAADVSSGSVLQAHANPLDTPFTLEARLYTCDRSVDLALQVSVPTALELRYEQPEALDVPLALGDRLRVDAVFADSAAPPQNLSAQVDVEAATGYAPDIVETSVASATVGRSDDLATCAALSLSAPCTYLEHNDYLMLSGLQRTKPVRLRLNYDPSGLALSATTREYRFANIDVVSLRLANAGGALNFPTLGSLQADAVFEDGEERPVTRYVSWRSDDADLLSVSASGLDGGSLTPQNLNGLARVYASLSSAAAGDIESDIEVPVRRQ